MREKRGGVRWEGRSKRTKPKRKRAKQSDFFTNYLGLGGGGGPKMGKL
jgi:hypothetical protein